MWTAWRAPCVDWERLASAHQGSTGRPTSQRQQSWHQASSVAHREPSTAVSAVTMRMRQRYSAVDGWCINWPPSPTWLVDNALHRDARSAARGPVPDSASVMLETKGVHQNEILRGFCKTARARRGVGWRRQIGCMRATRKVSQTGIRSTPCGCWSVFPRLRPHQLKVLVAKEGILLRLVHVLTVHGGRPKLLGKNWRHAVRQPTEDHPDL